MTTATEKPLQQKQMVLTTDDVTLILSVEIIIGFLMLNYF